MKMKNVTALLIAAAAGVMPLSAQQPAQNVPQLTTIVTLKSSKSGRLSQINIVPSPNNAKGVFAYMVPEQPDQPVERSTKDCKVFLITTPVELAAATRSYSEGNLSDARRLLAAVRSKYAPFVNLPDNPVHKAAFMELNCYARMQDWAGLGKLANSFPGVSYLEPAEKTLLEAARIVSKVSDDPASAEARAKEVESFLGEAKVKQLNSSVYGWLKYAQGRALASSIPADQLKGSISADKAELASHAVDVLCEAAMSSHGRDMELPLDAMRRAFQILWAMPGVKSYANSVRKMDKAAWDAAPYNFRDAVSLAYMIRNIFEPEQKDEAINKAAALFFNAREAKK